MAKTNIPKYIRNIDDLKPWDKNPRGIKKEDFEILKKHIQKLGIYKPLLINKDNVVLGGNMRLKAYKELGIKEVEVTVVDAQTEQRMVEYALSDNQRMGYYEDQALAELVASVPDIDLGDYKVDLGKPIDLEQLLQQFGPDAVEDEAPEVEQGEAVSKLGEIYQCGNHRVACIDSTNIEDVQRLMGTDRADMCFTDPPYGVNYEEKTKSIANQRKDILPVANDDIGKDGLKEIVFPAFQNINAVLKAGGVYYICSPQGGELGLMMMMMMDAGIPTRHMMVWVKDAPVFSMGRLDYDYQHEPILYGWKGSHTHYGNGEYKTSIWNIPRPKSSKLHPTMKPVALVVNAIRNSSKEGDIIIDLFGGSGTTLIASEETGRECRIAELSPHYVDVIRKRYAKFIDKEDEWETITPPVK